MPHAQTIPQNYVQTFINYTTA